MTINTFYTTDFSQVAYNLLKPFDSQKLNLMISGGSSLTIFNSKIFEPLNKSNWNIYFCDERIEQDHNIDEARNLMTHFNCPFHDLRDKNLSKDIDLAILGMGNDGHICSLFPNHKALKCTEDITYVDDSPKMPQKRITVTCTFLNTVKKLVFVVPQKEGVDLKTVRKPHDSIVNELTVDFDVFLHKKMEEIEI